MPLAEIPQTNKMHAVPQNIMDVEFKLIGDLTMRQFAYLIVFEGLAYFFSVTVIGLFKLPLVVIFAILGFALAFVPIQERGLDEWIANFIKAVYGPSQRIWRKEATIPSAFLYENINVVKQEMIALAPTTSRRKLEEYLHYQVVDKTFDPLDIPEAAYAQKVRDAFAVSPPEPVIQMPVAPAVGVMLEPELPETSEEQGQYGGQNQTSEPPKSNETGDDSGKSELKTDESTQQAGVAGENQSTTVSTDSSGDAAPTYLTAKTTTQLTELAPVQEPIYRQSRHVNSMVFSPITPDMHAGRRFTNLLPDGGEIILPIRGEKVLITSDEEEIEGEIREKAERLNILLAQIKRTTNIGAQAPQVTARPKPEEEVQLTGDEEAVSSEAAKVVDKLKKENELLTSEIEKLKSEPTPTGDQTAATEREQRIHILESQKAQTQADYAKLEQQILDLQNKLKQKEDVTGIPVSSGPSKPVYARIQPISTAPNVVTGIVKKPDGGILEGVLLIIKNDKGEAVRAFKTNSVGQFVLTTALLNGIYTLGVNDDKGANLSFDIISIEAKGEVIPPIEIAGREKHN